MHSSSLAPGHESRCGAEADTARHLGAPTEGLGWLSLVGFGAGRGTGIDEVLASFVDLLLDSMKSLLALLAFSLIGAVRETGLDEVVVSSSSSRPLIRRRNSET